MPYVERCITEHHHAHIHQGVKQPFENGHECIGEIKTVLWAYLTV